MILVDTSVWIDWLNGTNTEATDGLERVLTNRLPFGISGVIYQEILQDADSPASSRRLAEYFGTQRFYEPTDSVDTYASAADIYRRCREHGTTVRSTVDCLIVQLAIEHQLLLLHSDRDFPRIREIEPALQLF